jgi:hypothetical protein
MSDDPSPCWRAFSLPKRGHSAAEYEDAFAGNAEAARFALADGASESSFSGEWARLLVEAFVRAPVRWPAWLLPLQARWAATAVSGPLPWYAEAKFEQGAFATLLGVVVEPARGRWWAWAVGDSCVFHVRRNRLLQAFPRIHSGEFDNAPRLVGSRGSPPRRERARGSWRAGDRLLLMTDALAHWFLRRVEAGRRPWRPVERLHSEADFAHWIEKHRDSSWLRNDDVTLLAVGPPPNGS